MCQCPERGDLHFYLESFPVMKALLMSVNALKGATSISTLPQFWLQDYSWMCQCPERGDLHFYRNGRKEKYMFRKKCQCPERGDLHFYTCLWEPA